SGEAEEERLLDKAIDFRPRGSTVPHRTLPSRSCEIVDRFVQQPLFLSLSTQPGWKLVNPSMDPNFMPPALQHRSEHLGLQHRVDSCDKEGGRNLVSVEHCQDTGGSALGAEIRCGKGGGRRRSISQ